MYNLQEAYLGVYYDLDEGIVASKTMNSGQRRIERNDRYREENPTLPSGYPTGPNAQLLRQMAHAQRRGVKTKGTGVRESYDLYDLIFDYLLDEGYADTEEAATVIMANMSEDWIDDIYEEVLDEAHQIMSVNRDGKQIYKARRSQLDRPSNELSSHEKKRRNQLIRARRNADRRGDDSPARERAFDRFVSGTDTPFNRIRTSNIKKLNAPTDPDKYGDNDPYHTVKTDYRARRRRASGR